VGLVVDRKQEKLLEFILGNEAKKGQKLVEFYLLYIDNVLSVIQIFGAECLYSSDAS